MENKSQAKLLIYEKREILIDEKLITKCVENALREDLSAKKIDKTTATVLPEEVQNRFVVAKIIAKSDGILCGLDVAINVFKYLSPSARAKKYFHDKDKLCKSDIIAEIYAPAKVILMGERTALNFLTHLSGIATLTNKYVEIIKSANKNVKIYDTRKTLPGLRVLEKYAVYCGGGCNHRIGLYDDILIKDNHLKLIDDISILEKRLSKIVRSARKEFEICIEVDNLNTLYKVINLPVNTIMLDNMGFVELKKAVRFIKQYNKENNKNVKIEISGGVNFKNIRRILLLEPDRISIGEITHSAPILDISIEMA
jgi:nicotinate-nucleotide pyrophosphorylase (carboxylating)